MKYYNNMEKIETLNLAEALQKVKLNSMKKLETLLRLAKILHSNQ